MNLEKRIGYIFKNKNLLKNALTHSSSEKGKNKGSFERLEFLGDRVLGVIIANLVFEKFEKECEGDLAKRFTALVCKETCELIAKKIDLVIDCKNQNVKTSIIADGVEALIAAIFLDGGYIEADKFIRKFWPVDFYKKPPVDPKSKLQEIIQSFKKPPPIYKIIGQSGLDHEPEFEVAVLIEDEVITTGIGSNKKEAEHNAAKKALLLLNKIQTSIT